jgi:hypothetical protein
MHVSRVLIVLAALSIAVASSAAAQGAARGQGPKVNRPAQAQGPKTTRPTQAHGPKTTKPTQAQGPKADRPARPEQANRGNQGDQEGRSIAANIARNPQQEARLKAMLPAGMTLEQAADGFRNQGQFIAALEASKNQNIAFADLKAKMTGDTPLSLGQAIQELRPETAPTTGTAN